LVKGGLHSVLEVSVQNIFVVVVQFIEKSNDVNLIADLARTILAVDISSFEDLVTGRFGLLAIVNIFISLQS